MRQKKPDLTNKKTLAVSSLSGHGAALFLSVAVPFQIVGRVPGNILGGAFLLGAAGIVAFGFGAFYSASCVELSEQTSETAQAEYRTQFNYSLRILFIAGLIIGLVFIFTAGNLLSDWEREHPKPSWPSDYPSWLHQTPLTPNPGLE